MKQQIRKMYAMAIMKILFSMLWAILVAVVMIYSYNDISTEGIVICSILWGIFALVYLISGILTIKNGAKQVNAYMATAYPESLLEEEYSLSQSFGRIHIGTKHIFAYASNGFYVFPLQAIEQIRYQRHGYNPAKFRSGYYYLYIKFENREREIKVYFSNKKRINELTTYLAKYLVTN